jgi:ATPase family associated with various cellular activities (AAA)
MKRVFIFEGPDGTGKTTLAKALAECIGAVYVHHGSYPEITEDLHNVYAVSVSPAVIGESDVVLDRSWLSEIPYGIAYRKGANRLGDKLAALEHFVMERTEPLVVRCDASYPQVEVNFTERHEQEYLDTMEQLYSVWKWYREEFKTSLPQLVIWPFTTSQETAIQRILECA